VTDEAVASHCGAAANWTHKHIKRQYQQIYFTGLQVLTAVNMKSLVFWVVLPCSLAEVHQCFREIYCLHGDYVGFEVLTPVGMKSSIFWDITPCSPLEVSRHFEGICQAELCLPPAFMLVSCLAYPSTLKIEAICSSET
jgi:hypothetical protein